MRLDTAKAINKEDRNFYLQDKGGWGIFEGNSMFPSLKDGWKIEIEPVEAEKIRVGDVIVFKRDALVCHRVVGRFRKDNEFFLFEKGDNANNFCKIQAQKVLGRVIKVLDTDIKKVDEGIWNRRHSLLFFIYSLFSLFYQIGFSVRRKFFGERKNLLTHILGNIFWKSYYSLLKARRLPRNL